ncbi:MAG: hypothetical protein AAGI50_07655 [Pseudomonadota bacterium]
MPWTLSAPGAATSYLNNALAMLSVRIPYESAVISVDGTPAVTLSGDDTDGAEMVVLEELLADLNAGMYSLDIEIFDAADGGGDSIGSFSRPFAITDADGGGAAATAPLTPADISFAVYNPANDQLVDANLTNGEEIDGSNFTIVATPDGDVGSAVFSIDGTVVQTENVLPYALYGDNSGDFGGGSLAPGTHTVEVEFFEGRNGTGASLGSDSVTFDVAGNAPPPPQDEPEPPAGLLADWADHIVFEFDGNNNDPDDIAAVPMAALLTVAAGIEDKTTFLYGNNLAEVNNNNQLARLETSGEFARSLGIDARNYQDDIDGTTDYLVELMSSGDKVLLIEGGPMEAVYRALEQTDPMYHENLVLLSHSGWNETRDVVNRPGVTEARTWSDIDDDFPDVTLVEIRDQNNGNNNNQGFNNQNWDWMDSSDEPIIQDARTAMEGAQGNKTNDPSDAGMLYYALTGDENGTPQKAEDYFEASGLYDLPYGDPPSDPVDPPSDPVDPPSDPVDPPSGDVFLAQNGTIIIEAESAEAEGNWRQVNVDGETAMLWDANSSSYRNVPDGETLSYDFMTDDGGTYFLALHSGRMKSVMNGSDRYENGQNGAERTDTGNDAYISIINVETGEVVQEPTKLFTGLGSADRDLRWGTTFDENHQKYQAEFDLDANTQYRIEVTGRSDGYVLDRITLNEGSALRDASSPQSPQGAPSGPAPTPPAPPSDGETFSVYLADAETDTIITELVDGSTVDISAYAGTDLTIIAEGEAGISSMRFQTSDGFTQVENVVPYALFGDRGGDLFSPSEEDALGNTTVSLTAYSGEGASGSIFGTFEVDLIA